MRVVWNLVSGEDEGGLPQIRNIDAVKIAIDYIAIFDSYNVYNSMLSKTLIIDKTNEFQQRCNEEIEKAKKICEEDTWEEKIITAENYAFFRGSIRFLFRDSQGNTDWRLFDQKWENVQRYFKSEKTADGASAMNESYNNASLLKALISRFNRQEQYYGVLHWRHRVFNNKPNTWLYYLLHQAITEPVHQLLIGNDTPQPLRPSESIEWEHTVYQLSNTGLLDFVVEKIPYSWIRWIHNHLAIYPSGIGIFLNTKYRDDFLLRDTEITIYKDYNKGEDCIVGNKEYLYGWDIGFKYNGHSYRWYSNDYIYLLDDAGKCIAKQSSGGESYEERYYCFEYGNKNEDIKAELQRLCKDYDSDKEK